MNRSISWINAVAYLAVVIINVLANYLPLGDNTTGQVSQNYPSLFTPAPITFSIWGVIYLMMGVFVIFQMGVSDYKTIGDSLRTDIGGMFILSCLFNIAWIFTWHYNKIGLSLICIVGLLLSLLYIISSIHHMTDLPLLGRISKYGFDIYAGWISAATIANLSVFLVKVRWSRFGMTEQFFTMLVIIVGAVIGSSFIIAGEHYLAAAAIIWAYIGIIIKHMSAAGYNKAYPVIITACIASIVLMMIVMVIKSIPVRDVSLGKV